MRVAGLVEVLDRGLVNQDAGAAGAELHGASVVPLNDAVQLFSVLEDDGHLGLLLHLLLEVEGFGVGAFRGSVGIGDHGVRERIFGVHGIAAALYGRQGWTHQLAGSVEGVVLDAGCGFGLHPGSLYRHLGLLPGANHVRALRRSRWNWAEKPTQSWHQLLCLISFKGVIERLDVQTKEKGCSFQQLTSAAFELYCKGVEAQRAQQVTAHAALDGVHGPDGLFDPFEGEGVGEALEVGALVDVAEAVGSAGLQEEDVLEQAGEGAEERGRFGLALGAGAVGLGHAEEGRVVLGAAGALGGVEDSERVVAGGGVLGEVEGQGAARSAFRKTGGEFAIGLVEVRAMSGEEGDDLVGG